MNITSIQVDYDRVTDEEQIVGSLKLTVDSIEPLLGGKDPTSMTPDQVDGLVTDMEGDILLFARELEKTFQKHIEDILSAKYRLDFGVSVTYDHNISYYALYDHHDKGADVWKPLLHNFEMPFSIQIHTSFKTVFEDLMQGMLEKCKTKEVYLIGLDPHEDIAVQKD